MSNDTHITKKERDTLIILGEHMNDEFPMRLVDISSEMSLKPPTTLNLIKRLETKSYIQREKGMIVLTEKGISRYREILENHRIIETMLVKNGMELEKACLISENIDFLIDHKSIDDIFEKLGKPTKCPHGRNIEQYHP
ncbi:metal-dependent transcriptional regulator [Cuniculiplasma sp. SKW3]|uniref:metal-dependent transcriptional regulator n=1 Tax=Cuniculiplasma sp. SKW3 TaxID=3400170 RepID=UPI003FD158BE